jgi:hypothetical protein
MIARPRHRVRIWAGRASPAITIKSENPNEHLKVKGHDVKMRRAVISGVHANAHGAKALQGRHPGASRGSPTIAFFARMSRCAGVARRPQRCCGTAAIALARIPVTKNREDASPPGFIERLEPPIAAR